MLISRIPPQKNSFCGYQLDGGICWFLLLPSKDHADAKNELQFCRAKMSTKSEMLVKDEHQGKGGIHLKILVVFTTKA